MSFDYVIQPAIAILFWMCCVAVGLFAAFVVTGVRADAVLLPVVVLAVAAGPLGAYIARADVEVS